MGHCTNGYKYHFLSKDVPDILLIANKYPIKSACRLSQDGTFIGFHGCLNTDLESVFDEYNIEPLEYFSGKSKNMNQVEFRNITRTEGANDSEGFIPFQEGA